MSEEKTYRNDGQFEKFPYSFELRINDYIVCQRYFKINRFKNVSLYSTELTDTVRYCAYLIHQDLLSKTRLYNEYTAPQIFESKEQMNEWLWWNERRNLSLDEIAHELGVDKSEVTDRKFSFRISPYSYVILEDCEDVFFWDGEKMEPFTKYFNRADYLPSTLASNYETPCTLKFSFLVNDVEVCSTIWDGNQYPRFIRTNIDLSSSKNKYRQGENFSPFEAATVDILNSQHKDLIPSIVYELCTTCSDDGEFTKKVEGYSNKPYKNYSSERIKWILSKSE